VLSAFFVACAVMIVDARVGRVQADAPRQRTQVATHNLLASWLKFLGSSLGIPEKISKPGPTGAVKPSRKPRPSVDRADSAAILAEAVGTVLAPETPMDGQFKFARPHARGPPGRHASR